MKAACVALFLLLAGYCLPAAAAEPAIEMELVTEDGFPITGGQEWLARLARIGLRNIRIRQAQPDDEVDIIPGGTKSRPRYKLVGVLTTRDRLVLKGGSFGPRDMSKLKQFLTTLSLEGVEGVTVKRTSFGLTPKQLIAVVEDLTPPVEIETAGLAPDKVFTKIGSGLKFELVFQPKAARTLASAEPAYDEVKGISRGTALAALLRPYGLILHPHKPPGGEVQLVVMPAEADIESWPLGWPLEEPERKVVPRLFEFINVEIEGIELTKTLSAIQERLKVPFLTDHNQIALHRVDVKKEVTIPPGRSYYKRILDRALFQARLKGEIRSDEAGNPIYWITTIKK